MGWVASGHDRRGRPTSELSELRLDGGGAAGVFARATTVVGVAFSVDAGWEHAYGDSGPYLRAGVGLPFDLRVDRTLPRMPDQP